MKNKLENERIVQLFFTYNDFDYKFNEDMLYYKRYTTWIPMLRIAVSMTKFANSEEDVKTMCIMAIDGYVQGSVYGADKTKREIREFLGIKE